MTYLVVSRNIIYRKILNLWVLYKIYINLLDKDILYIYIYIYIFRYIFTYIYTYIQYPWPTCVF